MAADWRRALRGVFDTDDVHAVGRRASAGLMFVFVMAGSGFSTFHASVLGWSGWILPLLLIIALGLAGQFRPVASYRVQRTQSTTAKP